MEYLASAITEFISYTEERPLPPGAPTRVVLAALRGYLNANAPGWRERVFESHGHDAGAVEAAEVEIHLGSGRVVRGALVQRPSAAAP